MKITKILLTTALLALPLSAQADALSAWTQYADSHNFEYDADFQNVKGVFNPDPLPYQAFPNPTPESLRLFVSNLGNIDSLYRVTRIEKDALIYRANLENLNGLRNLEYVGDELVLFTNRLKDVHGLRKLQHVRHLSLIQNPLLHDLSGLSAVTYAETIELDHRINWRWDFVPIKADAWLCQPEQAGVFVRGTQAEACDQKTSNYAIY